MQFFDILELITIFFYVGDEFEDTLGAIRIRKRRRTDNTMAKRKKMKGQITIYQKKSAKATYAP